MKTTPITNSAYCIVLAFFCMVSMSRYAEAQNVGVNNPTPNPKALLDLTSSDKGLLTPRMTQAEKNAMFPIADPASEGMVIYQTNGTKGFYYYDGAAWNFLSKDSQSWSLTGNQGTTAPGNFIGTTDSMSMVFKTNNSERMKITPDGKIAIGVPNPYTKMFINGNDSIRAVLSMMNSNSQGWSGSWLYSSAGSLVAHYGYGNANTPRWANQFYAGSIANIPFVFTTTDKERMRIDVNGNIGIDTIAPQARMHVKSNGSSIWPQLLVEERDSADWSRISFMNKGSNNYWTLAGLSSSADSLTSMNIFHNSIGNMFSVRGNGRVAIGGHDPKSRLHVARGLSGMTPNPNSKLTVEDNTHTYINILSPGESGVLFGANSNATNGGIVYNSPGLPEGFNFRTQNNVVRMTLSSAGNLGIGNFVPQYPLSFQSSLGDKICLWGGTGAHYGFGIQTSLLQIHGAEPTSDVAFGYGSSAAFTEVMRVKGNGNVGIGTSTPTSKLHIVSDDVSVPFRIQNTLANGYSGMHFNNNTGTLSAHMGFANAGVPSIGGAFYAGTVAAAPAVFTTSDTERMRIDATGNVGIGTTTPTAKVEVNGYTKLGSNAPGVKMLKLTGTLPATQGGWNSIAHGLNAAKILSVDVLVNYSGSYYVPPSFNSSAGMEYTYIVAATNINLYTVFNNSVQVVGKPYKILITYEE